MICNDQLARSSTPSNSVQIERLKKPLTSVAEQGRGDIWLGQYSPFKHGAASLHGRKLDETAESVPDDDADRENGTLVNGELLCRRERKLPDHAARARHKADIH